MKHILHIILSHIKDSKDLLEELKHLDIPPGAKLFTADVTSLYTNIDTNTRLDAFQKILQNYHDLIPTNFLKETTLQLLMDNKIFSFGDMHWLQLQGTAMGTPAAPFYSIFTFSYHKNRHILNTFCSNITYYKHVWLDMDDTSWSNFKNKLDQFGNMLKT
jgi:hypothetical protein